MCPGHKTTLIFYESGLTILYPGGGEVPGTFVRDLICFGHFFKTHIYISLKGEVE